MGKMTSTTESKTRIVPRTDLVPPPEYKVIFYNDNVTTADFVCEVLITMFGYNEAEAEEITNKIHNEGSAIVAILPYELAEQKAVEVTVIAKSNGYPLNIKIEPVA